MTETEISSDINLGTFYGIGVGPGPEGLLPVKAIEALRACDIIYCPKADSKKDSVARWCIRGIDIPKDRFHEISFKMDRDRSVIRDHYGSVAEEISEKLKEGKNIGFLTLGDTSTYSTYGYTIAALLDILPNASYHTFPGITSYAAVAAATNWPLGEGKERVLILPCPDEMHALQKDIETHDIVILMKIGKRLSFVLELLKFMNILEHCVFSGRIGFEDEILCSDLTKLSVDESMGYLSTMLIRKNPREKRHL